MKVGRRDHRRHCWHSWWTAYRTAWWRSHRLPTRSYPAGGDLV